MRLEGKAAFGDRRSTGGYVLVSAEVLRVATPHTEGSSAMIGRAISDRTCMARRVATFCGCRSSREAAIGRLRELSAAHDLGSPKAVAKQPKPGSSGRARGRAVG